MILYNITLEESMERDKGELNGALGDTRVSKVIRRTGPCKGD